MTSPIVYNLFPLLAGDLTRWPTHAARAAAMNFNWIYLNPFHYPGFSGSLYAVKDYRRLHPVLLPKDHRGDQWDLLKEVVGHIRQLGMRLMVDLVINHTARDSVLVDAHPQWFKWESGELVSPSAIDPADARNITVWGDLAEIDNSGSSDRDNLWQHWQELVERYVELGFDGFRCDAAYKVPAQLWSRLIHHARELEGETVFMAETLGCRLPEVEELRCAGFDYFFNSSKWWAFDQPWCLEQHEEHRHIAPSIAFAESHDTPRLPSECQTQQPVVQQRYLFSTVFSEGVLMPIGFEFGFQKKLDVVRSRPEDWEEPTFDLTEFIAQCNRLKLSHPVLASEGRFELRSSLSEPTLTLAKISGDESVFIIINKDWWQPQTVALSNEIQGRELLRPFQGQQRSPAADYLQLQPAEIVLGI